MFKHLMPTKHAEAVVCHEYAQTGHGARMYGFFQIADGTFGRVDEFLDARQMVSSDVEDSAVRSDFAKELATFHTMKVPLEFQPVKLFYNALCHGLETVQRSSTLRSIEQKGLVDLGPLLDYDFAPKVMQIADKLASMGAKIGLCIHDVAFMNALVKNTSSNPDQSRVSLIDFEFAFQNYRAFDIGAHFMQKTFTWSSREHHKASWRQYKDDEKRHFCEVYAQQWNKLTGDSDTAEQIFLESQYGYMLSIAWDVFNMLWFLAEQGEKGDLNVGSLKKLSAEFEAQYAKLGFVKLCHNHIIFYQYNTVA